MFHPDVIAESQDRVERALGDAIPGGRLRRTPHDECWALRDQLADAVDVKGHPKRDLTAAEQTFITHERLLATLDYRYWSERWAMVAKETQDAEPLVPRWESQNLFLATIAHYEQQYRDTGHPDGILLNVLKARQLGISTETEVILAHRVTTQTTVRGLVAADVPEQSSYLLGMAETVIDALPWWLKPSATPPTNKGSIFSFETGSSLRVAAGKSQRGGLQDRGGTKGNIGRGKTWGILHLSELSTWERPEQIDDGLLPGVPRRPRTFGVLESTAKGRYDWWHHQWLNTDRGLTRFFNVFIPWYIEPDKYWEVAPDGWAPNPTTKEHMDKVERSSAKYLLGRTHRLSREQAYWYERNHALYDEKDRLHVFYEEYPATAEDAFQHAGRSIFSVKTREKLAQQAKQPIDVLFVEPAKDIATLKAWERDQAAGGGLTHKVI